MYDLNAREYSAIIPLIVLMVWMGSFTQSFLPPITATNARILAPIEAKKEIQVQCEAEAVRLGQGDSQCPLTSCLRAKIISASCPRSS